MIGDGAGGGVGDDDMVIMAIIVMVQVSVVVMMSPHWQIEASPNHNVIFKKDDDSVQPLIPIPWGFFEIQLTS